MCKSYKPDQMIACDNPQCLTEWYHFSCLGLKEAPKEDWCCPYCIDVHEFDLLINYVTTKGERFVSAAVTIIIRT